MGKESYGRITVKLYGVTWSELVHATGIANSELETNSFLACRWDEISDVADGWLYDLDSEVAEFPCADPYDSTDYIKGFLMHLLTDIPEARCEAYCYTLECENGYEEALIASYSNKRLHFFEVFESCDVFDCEECKTLISIFDTKLSESGLSLICPACKGEITADYMAEDDSVHIEQFELSGSEWLLRENAVITPED